MWERVRVIPYDCYTLNESNKVNWIPKTTKDFNILRRMKKKDLLKLGMKIWEIKNQKALFLFPQEWYETIPEGFTVYDIFGEREKFSKKTHMKENRFGALPYGIMIELR